MMMMGHNDEPSQRKKNTSLLRSKLFSGGRNDDEYGSSYLPTTSNGNQVQLQLDQNEEEVDRKAGTILKGVRVIKEIARSIGDELSEQSSMLSQTRSDMENTKGLVDQTLNKLRILASKTHGMLGMYCLLICFVFFVLFVLYTWIR